MGVQAMAPVGAGAQAPIVCVALYVLLTLTSDGTEALSETDSVSETLLDMDSVPIEAYHEQGQKLKAAQERIKALETSSAGEAIAGADILMQLTEGGADIETCSTAYGKI